MTAIKTLAAYGADPTSASHSSDVLHHAKRAVIDWYAALIPGAVTQPVSLLESSMAEDLDHGAARLALGRRCTERAAALINGTAAHTVEVDDIYKQAIYHPGAPTIAAALAAAQANDSSGLQFLRAVTIGYEISTRIGEALGRAHYRYWHNTGTVGTFGAAAAAAAVYRLDASRFGHALATAGTFAAGLQQAFRMDSMSKPLHAGRAAEGGLLAAQLARAGVTGSVDILDGDSGFGHAMGDGPDWLQAVATLGQEHNITKITFKNHACCGHTFAAIDGALALKQMLGLSGELDADADAGATKNIRKILISTYGPALEVAGNPSPQTAAEARFSIAYVVASAWLYGSVRLAAFTAERLADPAIRALMAKIELSIDPELDKSFPQQRAARISLETLGGKSLQFYQPNRKGDPEDPLSDAALEEKFLELVSPVLGLNKSSNLLRQLWALDSAENLQSIQKTLA